MLLLLLLLLLWCAVSVVVVVQSISSIVWFGYVAYHTLTRRYASAEEPIWSVVGVLRIIDPPRMPVELSTPLRVGPYSVRASDAVALYNLTLQLERRSEINC